MNKPTRKGRQTPLILAVGGKRPSNRIAQALVNAGANPFMPDANKRTAIHFAALNGLAPFIEAVIRTRQAIPIVINSPREKEDPNDLAGSGSPDDLSGSGGQTPRIYIGNLRDTIGAISRRGSVDSLEGSAPPSRKSSMDLGDSAETGTEAVLRKKSEHRRPPEKKSWIDLEDNIGATPYLWAIQGGNEEIAQLLEKQGAAVFQTTTQGQTVVHFAAMSGKKECLDYVFGLYYSRDRHLHINQADVHGNTPLHLAALAGHVEVISKLVGRKAGLQATDRELRTPLHLAASKGRNQAVKTLLNFKDAVVDPRDIRGETPLHLAVKNALGKPDVEIDDIETVFTLLSFHAEPNAQNERDLTPLHLAILIDDYYQSQKKRIRDSRGRETDLTFQSDRKIALKLIDAGAQVNIPGALEVSRHKQPGGGTFDNNIEFREGFTPLHCAALKNNTEIARLLLEKGADPCLLDSKQRPPYKYAKEDLIHEEEQETRHLIEEAYINKQRCAACLVV